MLVDDSINRSEELLEFYSRLDHLFRTALTNVNNLPEEEKIAVKEKLSESRVHIETRFRFMLDKIQPE